MCECSVASPPADCFFFFFQIVDVWRKGSERFERDRHQWTMRTNCPTGINSSVFVASVRSKQKWAEMSVCVWASERETCERARDDITPPSVPAGDPTLPLPLWTACGLDSDSPPISPILKSKRIKTHLRALPPPPTIHLSRCSRALLRHHDDVTAPGTRGGGGGGEMDYKHNEKLKKTFVESKLKDRADSVENFTFLLLLFFFFLRALKQRRKSDGHEHLHLLNLQCSMLLFEQH